MDKKFNNILIAGGDGFLGRNVAKKLKERNLAFISLDLTNGHDFRDLQKTEEMLIREKVDAVINCAAFIGGIQFGYQHPGEIFYNNIMMIANLMEASRLAGVKRFVNPISNCVYPASSTLFKEEELWNGSMHESVMTYGFAKRAGWMQGWSYQKQYGFDSVHLILPNMYGPEDHFDEVRSHALGALVMKFAEAKKRNKLEVVVWGTGKPIREWLFVEDGAEAMVRGLFMEPHIDPINIGIGKGISVKDLSMAIREVVGFEGNIVFDGSKPDGALEKVMDNAKMLELLKWQPETSLKSGIKKTIDWYLKNI